MKFTIDSGVLNKALKKLSPAVSNNVSIPILENVMCNVSHTGICELSATDLHLTITTEVTCTSKESFSVLLPFKQLLSITSLISEPLTIEVKENITLSGSKQKFKLGVADKVEHYPKSPDLDSEFECDVDGEFIYYLQKATRCTNNAKTDYTWSTYICIDSDTKGISIVATDLTQMLRYKNEDNACIKYKFTVDDVFAKSLAGQQGGKIIATNKSIQFLGDNISVTMVKSEQPYADYKTLFPDVSANLIVDKFELLSLLDQMSCLVTIRQTFSFIVSKGELRLKFDDNDFDKHFDTTIKSEYEGEEMEIYLNMNIMRNLLGVYPDVEKVNIYVSAPSKPVYLITEENDLTLLINSLVTNN